MTALFGQSFSPLAAFTAPRPSSAAPFNVAGLKPAGSVVFQPGVSYPIDQAAAAAAAAASGYHAPAPSSGGIFGLLGASVAAIAANPLPTSASVPAPSPTSLDQTYAPIAAEMYGTIPTAQAPGIPWGTIAAVGGGALLLVLLLRRRSA
jgi:hypothetical protein